MIARFFSYNPSVYDRFLNNLLLRNQVPTHELDGDQYALVNIRLWSMIYEKY